MRARYLIVVTLLLFSLTFVSSAVSDLGTVKQNDCISLYQYCPDCSYVNVTAISYPNNTINIVNIAMTKEVNNYNYTFCKTSNVGEYFYTVCGDKDGVQCEDIKFEVTPTGNLTPEGVPNVLAVIVFVIFGISCFFLFLSAQLNEVGPKIFTLLSSLVFMAASIIIGILVIQNYNIAESVSDSVSYIFYAVGSIMFIMFAYIMIRQTVNAFDLMLINKGLKMWDKPVNGPSPGRSMAGFDTRKPY